MSGFAGIGGTPVVPLRRLTGPADAAVWVKLEGANPTGSYKDRMALAMIEGAEAAGRLRPGQPVVEASVGSTGSALALVCAVKGYPLRIVSADCVAPAKLATMRAFGADVELVPAPAGMTPDLIPAMTARVREIAARTGAYWTDQFTNTDMVAGYRRLGAELLAGVPGPIDAVCLYVGTGGCFLGTSAALRERYPDLLRAVVEPAESAVLSGGPPGAHRVEGGGIGRRPPLLAPDAHDEVLAVPQAEAFALARRAARAEGILSGPSTGINLAAALRLARRLGPGRTVVTVQVDSGLKYLDGPLHAA
ncbi:cysteine synthase [Pilimelia anulata]|uniref:Cysteine synthase n=1 Tax=Pilimelia anulata TaxID=53371 RepID=A0A8J3BGR2_9ACTN|nr:cysteine synthase family protein [Pilimelia anulata]GGK06662.1 cysteine synthase [Pilimelia anulata]